MDSSVYIYIYIYINKRNLLIWSTCEASGSGCGKKSEVSRWDSRHGSRCSRLRLAPHIGLSPGPGRGEAAISLAGLVSSPGPGRSLGVVMRRWIRLLCFYLPCVKEQSTSSPSCVTWQSKVFPKIRNSVSTISSPPPWTQIHCLWSWTFSALTSALGLFSHSECVYLLFCNKVG